MRPLERAERRYARWHMGRVDLDKLNVGVILKYSEKPRLDPFAVSARVALALLEELMSTASIMGGNRLERRRARSSGRPLATLRPRGQTGTTSTISTPW